MDPGTCTDAPPPPIGPDEAHIWQVDLDHPIESPGDPARWLSPHERDRAHAFRFPVDRKRYLIGHAALRQILGAYLHQMPGRVAIDQSPGGKPTLAGDPGLRFSFSHSDHLALVALAARGEIGIDLERVRPDLDWRGIARAMFRPDELGALARTAEGGSIPLFFRVWTRMEALGKACGKGLLQGDERPPLLDGHAWVRGDSRRLQTTGPPTVWEVRDVEVPPGYAAALAWTGFLGAGTRLNKYLFRGLPPREPPGMDGSMQVLQDMIPGQGAAFRPGP